MVEFDALFFERMLNSFVLLLSFFLFLMIMDVADMEKREFCYNYIHSAQCVCNADVNQLLNDSVKIANVRDIIYESRLNILEIDLVDNFKK